VTRKTKLTNAQLKRLLPQERSTIGPIPYYPELRRTLRWHGPAILLVYLEIHHPEIQSPLFVDLRRIQVDLVVGRELFWTYFNPLGTVFQKPEDLWRAQRSRREFIRPDRQHNGVWRYYSLTRVREDIYHLRRNKPLIQDLIANCTPTGKLSQSIELAIPQTDTAHPEESGRFTTFSEENSLQHAGKWCGMGPKAAAAQLVSELAEVNPLLEQATIQSIRSGAARMAQILDPMTVIGGDKRRFTSALNLVKARAVALAKLTPEERSAKARAAALARYSKARGNTGNS
jgi:hypothetical protein